MPLKAQILIKLAFHIDVLLLITITFSIKISDVNHVYMSFDDVAIVTVRGNNYRIYIWNISKAETVNKMKNSDLSVKSGQIIKKKLPFLLLHILL